MSRSIASVTVFLFCAVLGGQGADRARAVGPAEADSLRAEARPLLDAPLLFVKRHNYTGIHIYDTYYKWPPGGGGIYILENPAAPRDQWMIRPVIDPTTDETLGVGVYCDPDISWDGQRVLFTFKGEPEGSTSIYEIGIDGRGLRRLSDPGETLHLYAGFQSGQHDVCPAYLPDGRIVFLSTRPSGLVPCNNTGVAILHVMNGDGTEIHPISVNNVNEFDPCVLEDGRVLFGRWEYIDKNALTIQSLWTCNPDGTQETALYANNMVFPEAILDARPVPGSHWIVGTFAKHNGTPRGSIAMVDPRLGKNAPEAIFHFENREDPTHDLGDSCEPWPLSEDIVMYSGRLPGASKNTILLIDRRGRRAELLSDPQIDLHDPMLIKPRTPPPIIPDMVDRSQKTGRFFVHDVYQGLDDVARGEVRALRILEETSRTSARPPGQNPYNQHFLVSCALAFSTKNVLGTVPVADDGSAYFEAPSGRALYLQALDADGRLVQSMRTFVQAAPGVTRSCVGCHEYKYGTTEPLGRFASLVERDPDRPRAESWGNGLVDYPSMVQPILDRHCVQCHGGAEGFGGDMDLSGGWTEHFNISYENLTSRRETQLMAYWIRAIDCMNGTALWSSRIFPPRFHGSGSAPLAELLMSGHADRIPDLTRAERDLLMAWIDTNGLYYGTWDYTPAGSTVEAWPSARAELIHAMHEAGCMECHGDGDKISYFDGDWINLQTPAMSRILRAPLAPGDSGHGLALCRRRKADPRYQRIHLLRGGYAHAVQPPEMFPRFPLVAPDRSGEPVACFASIADPRYQKMLGIIERASRAALAAPRIDMPGAEPVAGACRLFLPPPVPMAAPALSATLLDDGVVRLSWLPMFETIGLEAEVHRSSAAGFVPTDATRIGITSLPSFVDSNAPVGPQHYALVIVGPDGRSEPSRTMVEVPPPIAPETPSELQALPSSGVVRLQWRQATGPVWGYHVERATGDAPPQRVTREPIRGTTYMDADVVLDTAYTYQVRAVSRRGAESPASHVIDVVPRLRVEPVFIVKGGSSLHATTMSGESVAAKLQGRAAVSEELLDLTDGGHASFDDRGEFRIDQPISVSCWVRFDERTEMPVFVSAGQWNQSGWFLQWLGGRFRWHVGGMDCDGGNPVVGRWTHVAATYDGKTSRLYQDGEIVAEVEGHLRTPSWTGPLVLGQYSGGPAAVYQLKGMLQGVTIHHRPLSPEEIASAADNRP